MTRIFKFFIIPRKWCNSHLWQCFHHRSILQIRQKLKILNFLLTIVWKKINPNVEKSAVYSRLCERFIKVYSVIFAKKVAKHILRIKIFYLKEIWSISCYFFRPSNDVVWIQRERRKVRHVNSSFRRQTTIYIDRIYKPTIKQ